MKMKSLFVSAALLLGFSFSPVIAADLVEHSRVNQSVIRHDGAACRPVLIRRTTIYVDHCGREAYRTVGYRRAYLCEEVPACRPCKNRILE